ncbi:MAG: bifunctional hydroxymethylpyrimidine kinase/phosphomethylpyrimidine kinase [Bryobacteraceae bacterium]
MTPVALTIAGSDPSGGAGIQADLKTFHRLEAYGEAVITLITVQNTLTVDRVHVLDADLVRQQLDAVINDIPPGAAKTGALGNAEVVATIAEAAASFPFPLVVDPVLFSTKGTPLLDADGRQAMIELLLPRAFLLMPNLSEASDLAGFSVTDIPSMRKAAEALAARGPKNVLVKGGHLRGEAVDILFANGKFHEYAASRISTSHTHGTGCTFSAAVTAELSKGTPLPDAVARAKTFITRAIQWAPGLGSGTGPLNHF